MGAFAVIAVVSAATPSTAGAQAVPNPVISFVTVHRQADGRELRRETPALVELPALLRVDGDLLPDLAAQVDVLTPRRINIVIDRLPWATRAALPASVEVVARDPTGGELGRQRIAAGYDARGGRAPRRFRAALQLRVGGDPRHIAVQQDVSGVGDQLATTATLFDPGPRGARLRQQRIAVGLAPVPSTLRVDATLARPRIDARVTASRTTTATIDGGIDDGRDEQTLHAVADRLPASLGVTYDEDAAGNPAVTYDAAEPIARITAQAQRRRDGRLERALTAAVDDLPEHLRFAMTGPRAGTLTASAPIGQVEVAAARNREPRALDVPGPGVRALLQGDQASFALRLRGLRSARVDAHGPIALDAEIAPQPFRIAVAGNGRSIRGTIADLPARVSLRADVPGGAIDYDGHGAAIGRIAMSARGRFGPVRRIAVTIAGLPKSRVRFARERVAFSASRPLGTVDVVATDGSRAPALRAGRDGVALVKRRERFASRVRVSGVRRVAVGLPRAGPITLSLRRASALPIDVDVRAAAGRGAPLALVGSLRGLPDAVDLRLERARGLRVAYDASSALGAISLRARGGGLGRVVRLDARGLPRRLRIEAPPSGGSFRASAAGGAVGSLSVAVAPRGTPRPVAGGRSGIRVVGSSQLAVRVRGLQRIAATVRAPFRLDATLARQPFDITVDQPGRKLTGRIADLPRRIGLGVDLARGIVNYNGHGQRIARIVLAARLRARRVALRVSDFPSARVRLARGGGGVDFRASRPLGVVDATVTDGAPVTAPATRGHDLVHFRDGAVRVRLTGMQRVAFRRSPASLTLVRADRRRIDVDARSGSLALRGHIDGLARATNLTLLPGPRVDYRAGDVLRGLHLTASGGPLRGRTLRLDASDLPRRLHIDAARAQRIVTAEADRAIGSLSVAIAENGEPRPIAGGRPGLRVGRNGDAALRVRGLRRVVARTAAPFSLDATLARQPFDITVDQPGRRLTARLAHLPRRIGLRLDLPAGAIDYDGHGERLSRIRVDATLRPTGRLRLRRLGLTVNDMPSASVRLRRGSGGFSFAASQPLGAVDLEATDGSPLPPARADRDRVYYRDVRDRFAVGVRLDGLQRVAYASRPIAIAFQRASTRRVDVDARTRLPGAPDLTVRGHVDGLPGTARVTVARDGARTRVGYTASHRLRGLHLAAAGGPLGARAVRLDLRDLPRRVDIEASRTIAARADEPIGSLAVAIADGGTPRPIAGAGSGLRLVGDDVALRVRGLQQVVVARGAPLALDATLARQPFAFSVRRDGHTLRGRIADLPRRIGLTIAPERIRYDGHGERIGRLELDATLRRRAQRPLRVRGTITDVPSVTLRLGRGLQRVAFAADAPIGRIDLVATERARPPAARAARDRLVYDDRPGRYLVVARIAGLQRIVLDGLRGPRKTLSATVARSSPRPLDVDAHVGRLAVRGALEGLPDELALHVDTRGGLQARYAASGALRRLRLSASGPPLPAHLRTAVLDVRGAPRRLDVEIPDGCQRRLSTTASGRVRSIMLDARAAKPIFADATRVRASLRDLPARLRLTSGENAFEFDASAPVGELRVDATDRGVTGRAFRDGADGVYYRDLPTRYALRAQVTNLERVRFGGHPLVLGVERPGGQPIRFDVRTEPRPAQVAAAEPSEAGACAKPEREQPAPKRAAQPITLIGRLDGLPDRLRLDVGTSDGVTADYEASGPLRELALVAHAGIGGVRGKLSMRAQDMPAKVHVAVVEPPCDGPVRSCGTLVDANASAPIGLLELGVGTEQFVPLADNENHNKLVASLMKNGDLSLDARIERLQTLSARLSQTPLELVLETDARTTSPPLRLETTVGKRGSRWRAQTQLTLEQLPPFVHFCLDRGPACRRAGPRDATSSALLETFGAPLRVSGEVCFRRERVECVGKKAARLVVGVGLSHLEFGIRPTLRKGFLFLDTDGEPLEGRLGYVSGGKQRACFKPAPGFAFERRLFGRRPPGRPRPVRIKHSITLFGQRPSVRC